ncbi:MAG TPA: DNA repair protein RecN [Candidatus Limnocylindria bacterium]|nr:DNA repair protein RecN [Candidatus Limnocylindria bacterium]
MLLELGVRDLALIERARIVLEPGFTVVTGETGAGKSLLIDALGLVLGGRADTSLVRHGADGARVEAVFEHEPEPPICVRELSAAGRSLARIDDETVTAGRLAALAGPLVEIHGQHDQQRLLQPAWQRDVLDAYGGHAELRRSVAEAVRAWRANQAALRELDIEPTELGRRLELIEHAAAEIEAAGLRPGEVAELRSRLAAAGSAERIATLLADAYRELAEEGAGARDRLARAARAATEFGRLDPGLAPFADRLAGLEAEADDAALELRRRLDTAAEEGTDVAALEERLSLIYGLLRKYGDDESAAIAHGEDSRREADRLRGLEEERRRRAADGARLEGAARSVAGELTEARRRAGARLSEEIAPGLAGLGFPAGAFSVELAAAALDESGEDDVNFLLSPNPGEPARPLGRIASGGELSRVALALKVVLARADLTPTLVFDEVDAGIGGRSADPLGRSLWQLARHHQVICVTHLPQIAGYADVHLRITKHARDGRTVTDIARLDAAERQSELAQMLGGSGGEAGALAAAGELLRRAAELRDSAARAVA